VPIDSQVRRLALSCLLLGFAGTEPPRWLLTALREGLGGVVLFGGNVRGGDVRALTDRLRDAAGRDVVVALDEEGGDVTRLDDRTGSISPGAAALGHLDDPAGTEEVYAALGARLAGAGVTVDLAPVADVNVEPRNPVIGVRSFGADAAVVARHVAAAVRGVQRSGVAACAKHFPGHGATESDSHHEVAVLRRTAAQLREVEFGPFRAAVDAGTRAVMTGHLIATTLDADNLATVSPAVGRLLRGELGFAGTVVTDALEMRALAGTIGIVAGFVGALLAGADTVETGAVEHPELVEAIPAAVADALAEGTLTAARLEEAAVRTADLAAPGDATAGYDAAVVAGASRHVEVLGALPPLRAPLVVECRPPGGMASGDLPWSLYEPLAVRLPGTELVDAEAVARGGGRPLVVVVRDPHRHADQAALLDAVAHRPGTVVVDVGWPAFGPALPTVRTRGVAPGLLAAAADVLAGGAP
jgi:beta-N-acetylhexosaminidase